MRGKIGHVMGNGAAINVVCGFVPDVVHVTNVTDGDLKTSWSRGRIFTFTGGGTNEIKVGDTLIGATSGAVVVVAKMLDLSSGSWAAGTAAGTFIVNAEDVVGTPTTTGEKWYIKGNAAGSVDDCDSTTELTNIEYSRAHSSASFATATGNNAISAYVGTGGSESQGFTIGSSVAEEAKVLLYEAYANDD